ncbi:MAG: hypothetical protein ABI614_28725 [Planctomycetota bacterium]
MLVVVTKHLPRVCGVISVDTVAAATERIFDRFGAGLLNRINDSSGWSWEHHFAQQSISLNSKQTDDEINA